MCFCGDKFGLHGTVNTEVDRTNNCDVRCRGNDTQMCGGHSSNYIYSVNGIYISLNSTGPFSA